MLNTFAKTR